MRFLKSILILTAAAAILAPSALHARPKKGFHTGPYLTLEFGVMQADFDKNAASNINNGRDFEPTIGFLFGWNTWDFFSAEIQGRYTTNKNFDRREHIAAVGLCGKWTFIFDALTDFKDLRILPFAKAGISSRISALPGDPNSGNSTVASWGLGPSVGAGLAFMLYKYFYFGIDLQEDLLFFNSINQTVNGVPNTRVYDGGFHPSFGAMLILGVHY